MSSEKKRFNSFTVHYKRVVNILECYLTVHASGKVDSLRTLAFFDTGSNGSAISKSLAAIIKPRLIGYSRVWGITGSEYLQQFLIDLELPNNFRINDVEVSESQDLGHGRNGQPFGFLIGMDIITRGDLAVNHSGGYSTLSFRIPSISHVDYVEEYNLLFPPSPSE
jgi:hypothetical protein